MPERPGVDDLETLLKAFEARLRAVELLASRGRLAGAVAPGVLDLPYAETVQQTSTLTEGVGVFTALPGLDLTIAVPEGAQVLVLAALRIGAQDGEDAEVRLQHELPDGGGIVTPGPNVFLSNDDALSVSGNASLAGLWAPAAMAGFNRFYLEGRELGESVGDAVFHDDSRMVVLVLPQG